MTAPKSFPDASVPNTDEASRQAQGARANLAGHGAKIRRSALWAAYGDALGWISELTDEAGLKRRTAGAPLCRPIKWTRRIGGRSGVTTSLPQGCYSDDSQLRLATSRAIRPDVELPRFRGPLTIVQRRCPDGRKTSPLRAGVPAPDGGVGAGRSHARGAGSGVRARRGRAAAPAFGPCPDARPEAQNHPPQRLPTPVHEETSILSALAHHHTPGESHQPSTRSG